MGIHDINNGDLELMLLAGEDMNVGNINIKPLDLRTIIREGYSIYNEYLAVVTSEIKDFIDTKEVKIPEEMTVMDLILSSGNERLIKKFVNGLAFFLGEEDFVFDDEIGLIFGDIDGEFDDLKIVNHENFDELADVIRYQNCAKPPEEKEKYNPKNSKAKAIIERLKKAKEKVKEAKKSKDGDSNIDFYSIVSSVSTKSNSINKMNVWDLNMYQLYDEYKRLEMISGYDTSILAMCNGAEIKNLKHWSERIEDE